MIPSLHLNTVRSTNLKTALSIAAECGYRAVEITVPQLKPFLEAGFSVSDVKALLDSYGLFPTCVNDVFGVETIRPEERKRIFTETEWLCGIAEAIGCSTMQVCPLEELQDLSYTEAARLTAENIQQIADIAKTHNVTIQLETIAWSHINSLAKGLDVIDRCNRPNIGLSIDFWHLWAPGETTPEDVAALDRSLITNVHFCDGKRPGPGEAWDEMIQRGYFPNEGDIPLDEWMAAVKETGFDGCCSAEMVSSRIWQDLPAVTAGKMYAGMADLL